MFLTVILRTGPPTDSAPPGSAAVPIACLGVYRPNPGFGGELGLPGCRSICKAVIYPRSSEAFFTPDTSPSSPPVSPLSSLSLRSGTHEANAM